jgi:hypothetical protein
MRDWKTATCERSHRILFCSTPWQLASRKWQRDVGQVTIAKNGRVGSGGGVRTTAF